MSRILAGMCRWGAFSLAVGSFTACAGSGTGPNAASGAVQITLRSVGLSGDMQVASALFGLSASVAGESMQPFDWNNVGSLTIEVTSIQFLPATAEDDDDVMNGDQNGTDEGGQEGPENGSAWITLPLDEPVFLDLLNLPTEGESPIVIAAGRVEAGDYRKVRLILGENNTISFIEPFTVGQHTFEGRLEDGSDVPLPLTVPSGSQSGLKTDLAFTVEADENGATQEVPLLFDPDATLQNATATGSGKVNLAPVLRTR